MSSLSIVIPTYNDAPLIEAAIQRCIDQSVKPDEIIIVDDGSSDNTADILKVICSRHSSVKTFICEKNIGAVPAAKIGFDAASGDYVYFGATDDGIGSHFIEKTLQCASKYPDTGLVCSDTEVHRDGSSQRIEHNFLPCIGFFSAEDAATKLYGRHIYGTGAIYRRDVIAKSHMFDGDLRWHCDWFASMSIAFRHGVGVVPEVLSWITARSGSFSNSGRHNWALQSKVIARVFELVNSEEFRDILPAFIWSRAMNHFSQDAVRLILTRPDFNTEINRLLVRDAINGEI